MSKKLVALVGALPLAAFADLPTDKLWAVVAIVIAYMVVQCVVSTSQVFAGVHRSCLGIEEITETEDEPDAES